MFSCGDYDVRIGWLVLNAFGWFWMGLLFLGFAGFWVVCGFDFTFGCS